MKLILKSYNYQALMIKVFDKIQEGWRQKRPAKRRFLKWTVKLEKNGR